MKSTVTPILISGKQGSGKTSTAQALVQLLYPHYTVYRYRFAQPLYDMHDAVLKIAGRLGLPTPSKDGRLLQLLGTDWGCGTYGADVWVKCALLKLESIELLQTEGERNAVLVIDDLRFREELAAFEQRGGICFRLNASREVRKERTHGWRDTDDHISETDLDGMVDMAWNGIWNTEGAQDTDTIAAEMARYVEDTILERAGL